MVVILLMKIGAEILTKPTATEVVAGSSTFLNCSTNSKQEIHWYHTPSGSNQEPNFVYGYDQFYKSYISRFQMEKNEANGAYNLVIPSVQVKDAGLYECQDETGRGAKESAQLIVLDKDPVCEPNLDTHKVIAPNKCGIEPNQVILSCSVKYYGNEAPLMAWYRANENKAVSEGVTHGIIDNNRTVYNLTIEGNSSVKDGEFYSCHTTRSVTLNFGCKSGKTQVEGAVDVAEICQMHINAIHVLCIIFIGLPTVIIATFVVSWYLFGCRRKARFRRALHVQTPSETDDLTVEIEKHGKLNTEKYLEISAFVKLKTEHENKVKEQNYEIQKLQKKNIDSDSDIIQLKARVEELEQRLYPAGNIDYAETPNLAHKIVTDAETKEPRKPISGMTILSKELFVLHENSSVIEVYDSETFLFGRNCVIEGMSDPMDIASCQVSKCLYIVFRFTNELESHIMKFEPLGQLLAKWPTTGSHGRLSTHESHVIVCLFEKNVILEFTADGNIINTVRLSPAVGFKHPWHAIKVTSTHFVVCHGDAKDKLHRVCIVDAQGNIIKKLEQGRSNTLKVPICVLEDSERAILVADRDNYKIRLLNCYLKCERSLIKQELGSEHRPVRMCLDETNGRLFVAENVCTSRSNRKEWKDGTILIFNIFKKDNRID